MTEDKSNDLMEVQVWGYSHATGNVSEERWNQMDRHERRKWAETVLGKWGEPTDVACLTTENGEEEEW